MTGLPRLHAEDVEVRLGGRVVVEGLTAAIAPGEFVAVVGANGAGKSTVLKALTGLVELERGTVRLDDRDIRDLSPRALGQAFAYLPQDRSVYWPLTAERVVALGRLPHRNFAAGESASDRAIVDAAMRRMDVAGLARRPIVALSGGERARVLVARALAQEAAFLLADEPTAGLDAAHSLQLFEEFRRLAHEGRAIVAALHDLSLALRYATRVILLSHGRILADGPPQSVLNPERLAQAFGISAIVTTIDGLPVVLPISALP